MNKFWLSACPLIKMKYTILLCQELQRCCLDIFPWITLCPVCVSAVLIGHLVFHRVYRIVITPSPKRSKRSVVKRSLPDTCDEDDLYGYDLALTLGLPCYIAAELDASVVGRNGYRFHLGDGNTYGEFENKQLSDPYVTVTVEVSHVSRFISSVTHLRR